MKFSKFVKIGRADGVVQQIQAHTETVRALLTAAGDRAQHFLLWTNGGAVIASLTFMAASERVRSLPAMWWAVGFFVSGVIACGLLTAATYQIRQAQFLGWISDTREFFADRLDDNVPVDRLNQRNVGIAAALPSLFGYLSFVLFVAGVLVAFLFVAARA